MAFRARRFGRDLIRNLILALALSCGLLASAQADPRTRKWGPEFTFKFPDRDTRAEREFFERLSDVLARRCRPRNCEVKNRYGVAKQIVITFPDQTTITVGKDPKVLEVAATERPIEAWIAQKDLFENLVFGGMKEMGLEPTSLYGSGHLSANLPSLGTMSELANVYSDYNNYPALADGIFEKDYYNALPFYLEPKAVQDKVFRLLELARTPEMRDLDPTSLAQDLRLTLHSTRQNQLLKGHALYFPELEPSHSETELRAEFRGFRAQTSMQEFIDQVTLLDRRIDYVLRLSKEGVIIPLNPKRGAFTALQSLAQFYDFFRPLGLDWEYYHEHVLPAKYRLVPVLDADLIRDFSLNPCGILGKRVLQKVHQAVGNSTLK